LHKPPNLHVLFGGPLQDGPYVLERQVASTQVPNEMKWRPVAFEFLQDVLERHDTNLFQEFLDI
jgi:hypothetical protein